MAVRVFVLCLCLCFVASCDSSKDMTNQPKHEEPEISEKMAPGEFSMFDGNNLGQWKSTAFDEPGKVYVRDGSIILESGNNMTGVTWDGSVPRVNYEINFDAMRLDGEDFFCALTFPVEDSFVTFLAGGWGGNVCGISCVNYYDASDNETTMKRNFENNRWFHFRVRVTGGKIQCWIDKKQYVDLDTRGKTLDMRMEVDKSKPLGIASWQTGSAIKNIRLTKLPEPPSS